SCQTEFVKVTPNGTVTNLFAIPYPSSFAIDAAGIFYFSLADVTGVTFTVPHTTVNGTVVAVDHKGGIIYSEPGSAGAGYRLMRLNRDASFVTFPNTVPDQASDPVLVNFRNVGNQVAVPLNNGGVIV